MIKIVKDQINYNGSLEDEPITVKSGDRIAQAMIIPLPKISFVEVEELKTTARGVGGFGSTGA